MIIRNVKNASGAILCKFAAPLYKPTYWCSRRFVVGESKSTEMGTHMTLFEIVGLYVAINLLLHIFLMLQVGAQRAKSKVSLGDGGDPALLGKIRAQGNFVENAPMVLVGLIAMAFLSATPLWLHIVGAGFTVSRLFHAHGITRANNSGKGRTIGAILNLLSLLIAAIYILYKIMTG